MTIMTMTIMTTWSLFLLMKIKRTPQFRVPLEELIKLMTMTIS